MRTKNERLHSAVRQKSRKTKRGVLEQLFVWMFSGLVYPQIWEDPELDMEALGLVPGGLPEGAEPKRVVTIASGGCNVLSYLAGCPGRLDAVDLNPAHVALTRLKLAALSHLPTHESFFRFFGYADEKANVRAYDRFIRPHLDPHSRNYWEERKLFQGRRIRLFARNVYRYGMLGRFIGMAHFLAKLYGANPQRMLSARNLEQQRWLFENQLAPLFETRLVRFLCNLPVALYGLGIPPAQYDALAAEGNISTVLKGRLEKLSCDFPMSENYFAWQAFGRRYDTESRMATPLYLKADYYEDLREQVPSAAVHWASMTEFLSDMPESSYDGYVLLDAQDWMTPAQLTGLWEEITRTARPRARVVFRTAGEDSPLPGVLPESILSRWNYDVQMCRTMGQRDRSSIYGGFHVYEYAPQS